MKKFLAILLTMALTLTLAACLAACESEPKPLRILVDGLDEEDCELLRTQIEEAGGPTDIEFEILTGGDYEGAPMSAAERQAALTRLRTEVMAGKGPDVYIIATEFGDSLFRFPEKNLELGMFYPLDDLIENAQFMEWDEMIPEIMAAGYSEEWGQGILPMSYQFPVSVYVRDELNFDPASANTWEDMLSDSTGVLQAASGVHGVTDPMMTMSAMYGYGHLTETLGQLADYKSKKLLFTEEELTQRIYEILEIERKRQNGEITEVPEHYDWKVNGGSFYSSNMSFYRDRIEEYADVYPWSEEGFSFVPVYSDDGGITATVNAWCGIDANTKRIDDAFFVVDWLMGKDQLVNMEDSTAMGLAVYKEAGSRALPCGRDTTWTNKTNLTNSTFEELTAVRDRITAVNLYSVSNYELGELMYNAYEIYFNRASGDLEQMISDTYRMLRQSMSE